MAYLCFIFAPIYEQYNAKVMKLKELIDKYSFEDIYPFLKTLEPDKLDSMPSFREAYDLLRRMDPSKENCGKIYIEWSDDEFESDRYITVYPLSGDYWENGLAKEIVLSDEIQLDEREIAARCLWEITFFGFGTELDDDDESIFNYHRKMRNKYDIALYKLQLSHWKHTTPCKYRSKTMPLCTDVDFCMRKWCRRVNRSKRKRDYRVKCREEYLEKHSQREEFIQKLVNCGAFRREEVEYIHQVICGQYYPYVSRTWDGCNRIDYILDSINKYQDIDFSQFNDAIICVRTSSESHLLEIEQRKLMAGLPSSLLAMPIKFGVGVKESMKHEVEMMLFLNNCFET